MSMQACTIMQSDFLVMHSPPPPPTGGKSYPQDSSKRLDIADPHTTPMLHPLLEACATLPMLLVQYSDQT